MKLSLISIRNICNHWSSCFLGCYAAFLFFTWLLVSHTVNLNTDIVTLVQWSSRPPVSQSASASHGLNLSFPSFSISDSLLCKAPPPHLHLRQFSQSSIQASVFTFTLPPASSHMGGPVLNLIITGNLFCHDGSLESNRQINKQMKLPPSGQSKQLQQKWQATLINEIS